MSPVSGITTFLSLVTNSPEETREVGRVLGGYAEGGEVFLLTGELGAGKTCLTQGIAWGLGVAGYARSPTFVIATRYRGRLTLSHLDLFRIQDPREVWDLDLEEYISGEGVCVVEWADRAAEEFPPESVWIDMEYGQNETDRLIQIGTEDRAARLIPAGLRLALGPWTRV